MSLRPFTQPWADAFRDAINASGEYRQKAASWVWPLALVLDRAPELGYEHDRAILLELDAGHCRRAEVLDPQPAIAPFVIAGDYATWKEVVRGTLDPIAAIMKRRFRFEGALTTLVMNVAAAKALVVCAGAVPTEFPDERGPA